MAEIRMPKMGDGMEEGTLLRWLKKEGEEVTANETIAEIETDKANVEMPAEESGTLTKIVVQEGQTVPVGAVIGHIGEVGAESVSGKPAAGGTNGSNGSNGSNASAASGAPSEAVPAPEPPSRAKGPSEERVKSSPLARKRAQEAGIDLAQVTGTGPGGRIVEKDIAQFVKQGGGAKPMTMPGDPGASPAPARPMAATAAPTLEGQDVDVNRMRKAIANVTTQSKQTIPHFYLVTPVEMDRALSLLADMNAQNPDQKITVNDVILKACAVTLSRFPDVNVTWTPEGKVRKYTAINLGFAVGTDQGLTIPVVPDCGNKTLRQISAETKGLAGRARGGQITPQEMSSSTFSTSNLGMFGIEEFLAIISPPNSCMLAIGAVAKEVLVADDGSFRVAQRMRVTLSCDHRTVDGVLGAKFLQELKKLLEAPMNLLA